MTVSQSQWRGCGGRRVGGNRRKRKARRGDPPVADILPGRRRPEPRRCPLAAPLAAPLACVPGRPCHGSAQARTVPLNIWGGPRPSAENLMGKLILRQHTDAIGLGHTDVSEPPISGARRCGLRAVCVT